MKEWVVLRGHKKKSAVRCVLLFKLQDLTRRRHFTLKQPWHGTLCIPFSSLVAPKARSSIGTSPLRQQGHRHRRPPRQPRQHRTPLSAPAPQIPPRATLSQAHDSNLWVLTFHPLGHLLVSASNDHATCFWARERPGDAASVFAPGGAKPAAADADGDADGEAEDEDDVLAVPGFGSSASVVVAGAGGGWWNSADTVGGAHGGVGPSADDDIVPGFWRQRRQ